MISTLLIAAGVLTLGFVPSPVQQVAVSRSRPSRCSHPNLKKNPEEDLELREAPKIAVGSIVEFHDPTHGAGKKQDVLGVVTSCELKAKGGSRIHISDSSAKTHTVAEKALHIVLPPSKGKSTEPAEILASYAEVMEHEDTDLGVDPELLEIAWTICAESEKKDFSPKNILNEIDDSLIKNSVDAYRAFRLLSSDLGKIFFKSLGHNRYKPKAQKAVQASKESWCHAPAHENAEYCFL